MHCSKALPDLPHATQEGLDRVREGSFTEPPLERFLSGALESGLTFEGWPVPALHKRTRMMHKYSVMNTCQMSFGVLDSQQSCAARTCHALWEN